MKKIKIDDKEIEISDKSFESLKEQLVNKEGDASEECYFNNNNIIYINPYDKTKSMYISNNEFNLDNYYDIINNGKKLKQDIVWREVKNIKDLKIGDFIKNSFDNKGIITNINSYDYITIQYFSERGIEISEIDFDIGTIEKAVYLGEKE